DRSHAVRLVEALAARDGAAVIAAVDQLRELGLSAAGTLEEMATLLQQVAVQQAVPDALDPDDPDAASRVRLAARLAPDETQLLYSIVLHGRAEIGLAPDEYSGLVMVLLRMLAFPAADETATARPAGSGAAAPSRAVRADAVAPSSAALRATRSDDAASRAAVAAVPIQSVAAGAERRAAARSATPANVHTAPPDSMPSDSPDARQLGDRWVDAVQRMTQAGSIAALVRELALQAQCIEVDDDASPPLWRLRVEREMLRAPAQCEKLQAALVEVLGRAVRIEIESGVAVDTPASREAAERARRQAEAEQTIHDDPLVQALMAQYKTARIVPGSVKSL
ncbi:MAG: DNA polymerase III subunit gamma/tau C-terminal domain-containing protein, partial [Caldimonas sp.]